MATHARIFYYAQRIGVTIDFARYQSWLEENHDHTIPDVLPDEYLLAAETRDKGKGPELSTPSLPWQDAAPKTALYVDRQAASASAAPGGGEPNYPMAFAEMLKLLQEGKPIPGIRQIPNTVIRDPVRPPLTHISLPNVSSYVVSSRSNQLGRARSLGSPGRKTTLLQPKQSSRILLLTRASPQKTMKRRHLQRQ
jgi:hypothetical protein